MELVSPFDQRLPLGIEDGDAQLVPRRNAGRLFHLMGIVEIQDAVFFRPHATVTLRPPSTDVRAVPIVGANSLYLSYGNSDVGDRPFENVHLPAHAPWRVAVVESYPDYHTHQAQPSENNNAYEQFHGSIRGV